uniref:Uncharacterized protein n=1 Tax=Strongyloides venezuelensis TaxID=75913 RepID=A0A0K0FR66_STRVS
MSCNRTTLTILIEIFINVLSSYYGLELSIRSITPAELFLVDMFISQLKSESLVDCLSFQQNTEQLRILRFLFEIALRKWLKFTNDETPVFESYIPILTVLTAMPL